MEPAATNPAVTVAAIAARNRMRAAAFAAEHGIESAFDSYEELIADPDIDAVYIPLPNGLHGRWTIAAVEAGKHVLCEKPFAANAAEARRVADAVSASDRVVMNAFHFAYHPLMAYVRRLIDEGTIGELVDVRAFFNWPALKRTDIRFDPTLAGGCLMDLGSYAVQFVRMIVGAEPQVRSARAREWGTTGIDESMRAKLSFPNGVTGSIACSFRSPRVLPGATIVGSEGTIRIHNFVAPQARNWVSVRTGRRRRRTSVPRTPSTYECQIAAFADAILRGAEYATTAEDAVAAMQVIDAIYTAAGLQPREPTP